MRKKIVMGNWKMHGNSETITLLLRELLDNLPQNTHCAVLPPSIYLPHVQKMLSGSPLAWGAQNVFPQDAGAYTGELSAPMLLDYACRYVLVGHSERRRLFHEDEKFIAEKFHHVKDHGMIPVLCVGETLDERQEGLTESVLIKQLSAITQMRQDSFKQCVIAYEPVWAIGTGKTAEAEEVQRVHSFIREMISSFNTEDAQELSIIYGGSVNEKNARSLFVMPDVDGGLVGGASLNAQQFVEIVKCINCY